MEWKKLDERIRCCNVDVAGFFPLDIVRVGSKRQDRKGATSVATKETCEFVMTGILATKVIRIIKTQYYYTL